MAAAMLSGLASKKSGITEEERKAATDVEGRVDTSKVTGDTNILKLYQKQFKAALWDCANAMADPAMFGTDTKVRIALAYIEEKFGGKKRDINAWLR